MMSNIIHSTTKWSRYTLTAFFLAIILLMASNEFFQIPHHAMKFPLHIENPIEPQLLEQLKSVEMTNNLGSYRLVKDGNTWQMVKPRSLQAHGELMDQIISSLRNLKVRRLYEKDKINLRNFSLHKPSIHIKLSSQKHSQNLTFGLLNSIDDSTYLIDDHSSLIYQVDSLKVALHSLSLNELIDSSIFKITKNKIQRIQVKQYPSRRNSIKVNLIRKGTTWESHKKEKLDEEKTQEWLSNLLSLKADIILDKRSHDLEKKITEEMNRPSYTVSIREETGEESTYKISRPLSSLENIKIGNKKFILVTSSIEGVPPIITDKSLLEFFEIKAKRLRIPSPQKIFY